MKHQFASRDDRLSLLEPSRVAALTHEMGKEGLRLTNCFDVFAEPGDLRQSRANVRRFLNAIHDEAEGVRKNPTGEKAERLEKLHDLQSTGFALIAEIDARIDSTAAARAAMAGTGDESGMRVLRGVDDIRAYYADRQREAGPLEGPYGLADFVRGAAGMRAPESVRNALSIGTDSEGGYAVPSIVMPKILEALVPQSSLLRAGAGIVMLEEGAKTFTTAAVDTIPTAAWRAEAGAVSESNPAFRGVVTTPRSLAFYFKVSRELLQDAANMETALANVIGQSFAKAIDKAGLRGSGTAPEPRGILNTSGIQSVTNGTNGASLASYANFLSAVQAILQADAPEPTAAIMSPRSLVTLGGLKDTTNQPLRRPPMLESMSFLATSQIPNNLTVGTSTDCSEIYVGDFTKIAFMFREQMSIQLLKEAFATTGQLAFVCHARVDVTVFYPTAFSVVTGVRA